MNEEKGLVTHDRPAWSAKFFTRLMRYRNLLVERWWVPVVCVALALAAGAARIWFTPPKFVSVGQMIVSIKLNIQQGSLYTEELNNFLGTQSELMKGTEVQNRARDRVAGQNPGLQAQPVSVDVNVIPKTTIFILRATGSNPGYTKEFLQACMEEYINLKKAMVERTSSTTIAGLTDQMLRLEPDMQRSDAEMQSFLATNDVALLEEASGVGNYLAILYQQLAGAGANQQWVTKFETTTNGTSWSALTLAQVPANRPPKQFDPYLGDYEHLMAVGKDFYGIFSANNTPKKTNFPNDVVYQRNVNWETNTLLDIDNITPVGISIDPFFFRVAG